MQTTCAKECTKKQHVERTLLTVKEPKTVYLSHWTVELFSKFKHSVIENVITQQMVIHFFSPHMKGKTIYFLTCEKLNLVNN